MTTELNPVRGLIGVIGIWLTAAISLPMIKLLPLSAEQFMVARGVMTVLGSLWFLRGFPRPSLGLFMVGLTFSFANWGLYRSIQAWGASLSLIVVTMIPLVTFVIALKRGRGVAGIELVCAGLMLFGVTLALLSSEMAWSTEGFLWVIFAVFMAAICYEFLSSVQLPKLQKTFAMGLVGAIFGLLVSFNDNWVVLSDNWLWLKLIGFGLVGGFLYLHANTEAFAYLPTNRASILAQGETPAVIIAASLLLGEPITLLQWLGVGIAMWAAYLLSKRMDVPS